MNFSLYIAKRYLFSKSSNNTINIITLIATVGVIVGTMSLFVVLSGFSGLKTFSLNFESLFDPEIQITSHKGKTLIADAFFSKKLKEDASISQITHVIEERAFFEYNKKTEIAYIKAVDTNYINVNKMDTTIVIGKWVDTHPFPIAVVGAGIANKLSIGVYSFSEPLKIYVPKPQKGYSTSLKNAFNEVFVQPGGIIELTQEVNNKYVFIPLELGRQLLNYKKDEVTAVEIKLTADSNSKTVAKRLQNSLGDAYVVKTRIELNAALHKMLNTENLMSYLLFTLVVIISLFNVIGAIIMMILDKKGNIKTLNNLGCTLKQIKTIFVLQGFLLSAFGLFIGLGIGILLITAQLEYSLFMINSSFPYPVELNLKNIITVILTILILGFIAAKIASSRISERLIH
ncbi:MAG: ABC transporter permease [Flavobacteriaceae bacterium]|nr:MAG: ABC transporter permease [Flavobacteriaceae bacterium]